MTTHNSLENWYRTNFQLMHGENWSHSDLLNLIPWEREVYLNLAIEQAEREAEAMKANE